MAERIHESVTNLHFPPLTRRQLLKAGLATLGGLAAGGAIMEYLSRTGQAPEVAINPVGKDVILPINEYDTFTGVLYVDEKNGIWGEAMTMALVPTQDGGQKLFWFATPKGVVMETLSDGIKIPPTYMADIVAAEGNSFTAITKDGWNIKATKDAHGLTGVMSKNKPGEKSTLTRLFSVSSEGNGKEAVKKGMQQTLRVAYTNLSGRELSEIYTKPIEDAVGYQDWPNP